MESHMSTRPCRRLTEHSSLATTITSDGKRKPANADLGAIGCNGAAARMVRMGSRQRPLRSCEALLYPHLRAGPAGGRVRRPSSAGGTTAGAARADLTGERPRRVPPARQIERTLWGFKRSISDSTPGPLTWLASRQQHQRAGDSGHGMQEVRSRLRGVVLDHPPP
jgi:hypothetical protein